MSRPNRRSNNSRRNNLTSVKAKIRSAEMHLKDSSIRLRNTPQIPQYNASPAIPRTVRARFSLVTGGSGIITPAGLWSAIFGLTVPLGTINFQSFKAWGSDVDDLLCNVAESTDPTGSTFSTSIFQDYGTPGHQRAHVHAQFSRYIRSLWLPNTSTDTLVSISVPSSSTTTVVVVDVVVSYKTAGTIV